MKKLAIFVEGQCEQLFVRKLLYIIAGENNIAIDEVKAKVNSKGNRSLVAINASSKNPTQKYYVLICDCGGESTVKSDIVDNYKSLSKQQYQAIIGLRDVYPRSVADIPMLERYLKYYVPTKPISVDIILAIMEVESWFLAETSHFCKIHPSLTLDRINKHLNFNPETQNVEERICPADDLNSIYKLEGLAYNKRKSNCQRTVDALEYSMLYVELSQKVSSLGKFIKSLDTFLS